MAERSHSMCASVQPYHLCLSVHSLACLYVFICPTIYASVHPSVHPFVCVYLSVSNYCLSICPSLAVFNHLFFCLFVSISPYIFLCVSISVHLSSHLCVSVSVHLSNLPLSIPTYILVCVCFVHSPTYLCLSIYMSISACVHPSVQMYLPASTHPSFL